MTRPLRIVVAGMAAGFPLGGQVWMNIHYLQGFRALGHEVIFVEDTSPWCWPFDPYALSYTAGAEYGTRYLERLLAPLGLSGRWYFRDHHADREYGMPREQMRSYCEQADLLVNVSGVVPLRDDFLSPAVTLVINTDPVFTEMKVATDPYYTEYYKAHDLVATWGVNIPGGKLGIDLSGLDWIPSGPPIDLDVWTYAEGPGTFYTTVGAWDAKGRDVEIGGEKYEWRKSIKFERLRNLPRRVPEVGIELATCGMGPDETRFNALGWRTRDSVGMSRDIYAYRDYIRASRAEFTVAKDQNVRLKSGWFSDRSAAYLASGRPVITEDTGFGTYLPLGEGLFAFETEDEVVEAIHRIEADYEKARQSARRIAQEHFDAKIVLQRLLDAAGLA